jgi:hypothetical protein
MLLLGISSAWMQAQSGAQYHNLLDPCPICPIMLLLWCGRHSAERASPRRGLTSSSAPCRGGG